MKNKTRVHPDVIISGISIVFSCVLLLEIWDYPADVQLFPKVFLIFFMAFMAIVLARGILRSRAKARDDGAVSESEWWCKAETVRNPIITAGFVVAYVALIGIIGFYLSSLLYMCSAMYYFGSKKMVRNFLISIVVLAFIYALITWQLSVTLPMGIVFESVFG